jgi:hypothetical protein
MPSDPFGGSGSTLISCDNLDRKARVVEIDPVYVDVSVRRWQDYTGSRGFLEGDGRSWRQRLPAHCDYRPPQQSSRMRQR